MRNISLNTFYFAKIKIYNCRRPSTRRPNDTYHSNPNVKIVNCTRSNNSAHTIYRAVETAHFIICITLSRAHSALVLVEVVRGGGDGSAQYATHIFSTDTANRRTNGCIAYRWMRALPAKSQEPRAHTDCSKQYNNNFGIAE